MKKGQDMRVVGPEVGSRLIEVDVSEKGWQGGTGYHVLAAGDWWFLYRYPSIPCLPATWPQTSTWRIGGQGWTS